MRGARSHLDLAAGSHLGDSRDGARSAGRSGGRAVRNQQVTCSSHVAGSKISNRFSQSPMDVAIGVVRGCVIYSCLDTHMLY